LNKKTTSRPSRGRCTFSIFLIRPIYLFLFLSFFFRRIATAKSQSKIKNNNNAIIPELVYNTQDPTNSGRSEVDQGKPFYEMTAEGFNIYEEF